MPYRFYDDGENGDEVKSRERVSGIRVGVKRVTSIDICYCPDGSRLNALARESAGRRAAEVFFAPTPPPSSHPPLTPSFARIVARLCYLRVYRS